MLSLNIIFKTYLIVCMKIKDTFFLKNMSSNSCIKLIQLGLGTKEGVEINHLALGIVRLEFDQQIITKKEIIAVLQSFGFPIIIDPNVEIAEKTKIAAIELIYHSLNANSLIRNSDYISDKLQLPYDKISRVFSQVTGTKLEKYIILLKIEKSKELLMGTEYTVSEIAYMMDYSSVQYLSNQFKKVVGVTISKFKESPENYRIPLERLI